MKQLFYNRAGGIEHQIRREKRTTISEVIVRVKPSSETQGLLAGTMRSIWELILTEPVPEVVEFCPADWAEKYFSAQSAMRSSRVTLSPSYTK